MAEDVSPDKQNIDALFSNTTYYIDFYQREYKWNEVPVKRLLEDVFYIFNEEYIKFKNNDTEIKQLINKYSWYYLNTYVTNLIDGKIYVVDGQQRLTTITLILIKLYIMSEKMGSDLRGWIKNKIHGQAGFEVEFWMNHSNEKDTLELLMNSDDISSFEPNSITSSNMIDNFKVISKWIDNEINDLHKFERFTFYFLKRIVLINLSVNTKKVPMVFEVINDRGERLKPYEILKGKLLGQIDKEELVNLNLNTLWEDQVNKINKQKEDELDKFFIYYLKAKLATTRGNAQHFDKEYHRAMFDSENDKILKLKHNPAGVKDFLKNNFKYYTNLYVKIFSYYDEFNKSQPFVYYNRLTEMDFQFMLILSACKLNDVDEDEKINVISRNLDRLFCLLQLQKSYDSNSLTTELYHLNSEIREKDIEEIKNIFNKYLLKLLSEARNVEVTNPISYTFFKETGIELNKRFKRYFYARIEDFISTNTKMNMKQSLYDLVQNTGVKNGFHIEHILAKNEDNLGLFNDDEDYFERERNRLGGLLLLKGQDNISSNNEVFTEKLKSYSNTLLWNESLREDFYKSKMDFKNMMESFNLNFTHLSKFGPDELEQRHKLLYDMASIIWGKS